MALGGELALGSQLAPGRDGSTNWHVPPDDLCRIANSCPRLQSLSICGLLEPGGDLTHLRQLIGYKSLCVGGAAFDNEHAAPTLVQLTQLTSLEWVCSYDYPQIQDLAQLLLLTQLQHLALTGGDDFEIWPLEYEVQPPDRDEGQGSLPIRLTSSEQVRKLIDFKLCCGF